MSNMLAWPPPPQPQKEGFQNSMETKVGTRVQAYSAMTTTSNRERSRPLGQASARWASAPPLTVAVRFPIVNASGFGRLRRVAGSR